MGGDITCGSRLKADGSGLVGEVRLSAKELEKLGKSAKGAGRGARRLERDTAALQRRMKASSAAAGMLGQRLMGLVGGYAAMRGVKAVVTAYAGFEQGLLNVASVSGATAEEFEKLKTAALAAAGATRFDTSAATDALYALASAGMSAEEQMASLMPVLDLATAIQADLGQAGELVAGSLKTFGLEAGEARSEEHTSELQSH